MIRGIGANLVGVFPVQALKLASNDLFRDWLADENGHVSLFRGMLAGAGAGCVQVIASNPMEITKIRLQIQPTLPVAERKNFGGGSLFSRYVMRSYSWVGYQGSVQRQFNYPDAWYSLFHDFLPSQPCSGWFDDAVQWQLLSFGSFTCWLWCRNDIGFLK